MKMQEFILSLIFVFCYISFAQGQTENLCIPNPCENNGICSFSTTTNTLRCQCPPNYEGTSCQTFVPPTAPPVDPCESQPCLNEGRCVTRPNQTFVCVCSSSFAGPTCAENADGEPTEGRLVSLNPCTSNPCLNGGFCIPILETGGFGCSCVSGFSGNGCELQAQVCPQGYCNNRGQCRVQTDGTFYCQCQLEYSGPRCLNRNLDPCSSNPCLNGGFCTPDQSSQSYTCQCQSSFLGRNCQRFATPCPNLPCQNGECVNNLLLGSSCRCDLGYTGRQCEIQTQVCPQGYCSNRGQCRVQTDGTFICQCQLGFSGPKCLNQNLATNLLYNNLLCPGGCPLNYACQYSVFQRYHCRCRRFIGGICEGRFNNGFGRGRGRGRGRRSRRVWRCLYGRCNWTWI